MLETVHHKVFFMRKNKLTKQFKTSYIFSLVIFGLFAVGNFSYTLTNNLFSYVSLSLIFIFISLISVFLLKEGFFVLRKLPIVASFCMATGSIFFLAYIFIVMWESRESDVGITRPIVADILGCLLIALIFVVPWSITAIRGVRVLQIGSEEEGQEEGQEEGGQ